VLFRSSLGLKQTQEDPWQRVIDTYRIGDELEGKVTKVVTFGAFVEILDGVEGLVHISELAHHHVENPREVVEPDASVKVKVLEIDSERRRLSLSIKRVAGNEPPPSGGGGGGGGGSTLGRVPDLGLSDDVFAGPTVTGADDLHAVLVATSEESTEESEQPAEPEAPEAPAEEPVAEAPVEEASAEDAAADDAPADQTAAEDEPADQTAAEDEPAVADDAAATGDDEAEPETDEG
jgi:small subunit ribosomal protein S1